MNTNFLKNSNRFFGWLYALMFFSALASFGLSFAGVSVDIPFIDKVLSGIRHNNRTEWIWMILIVLAFLYASFTHFQLVKAISPAKITYVFVWATIINLLTVFLGLYLSLTCRGEGCLVVLFPVAIVTLFFFVTVIVGTVSLAKSR